MTRRRWIADEFSESHAALSGDHANHLIRVLRARVGQEFDVATGAIVRRGQISLITDDRIEFKLGEIVSSARTANITLLLSIFKFDRFEWAIEKCTELGVTRIVPVIARRTDTHLGDASLKRADRWRKIALQAAQQSRRAAPPEVMVPIQLREGATMTGTNRIVLSEAEQETHLRDLVHPTDDEIILAIGPEGGWTEDELHSFQTSGWLPATLGPTILRAETAAIAATAIVLSELC